MRISSIALVLSLLPLCGAIEAPKSFLRSLEEDNNKSSKIHRHLDATCPVCSVMADGGSNDSEDNGKRRGFFGTIIDMARTGTLRSTWDYFLSIFATIVTAPRSVHPVRTSFTKHYAQIDSRIPLSFNNLKVAVLESIVLFVDQMGVAGDSVKEMSASVQADGVDDVVVDLFDIFEDLIRAVQRALTGFTELINDGSVDIISFFANGGISILGIIEEINLSFLRLILEMFSVITGVFDRRDLKEQGVNVFARIDGLFDGLLELMSKLTMLSEAAGLDAGTVAVLTSFKTGAEGLYDRMQVFWNMLSSTGVQGEAVVVASEKAAAFGEAVVGTIQDLVFGVIGFTVDIINGSARFFGERAVPESILNVASTIFERISEILSAAGGLVTADSVLPVALEIVDTPTDDLAVPGCELDRVVCLAKSL